MTARRIPLTSQQTYLSEYEDDGDYGHISLGRSFALEMAALIPQSDQRLGMF